ncbi:MULTISPECIES: hypothetical protein [unclassified Algoriphagus]|jgi:hypothetical protein|nr:MULTISPECIES: hypothetical protein [unclassified Algoriphagus]QYH37394.1 hypothetical protein GYM62_00670 [Algoriphagus sp. NBT04N3]
MTEINIEAIIWVALSAFERSSTPLGLTYTSYPQLNMALACKEKAEAIF